VIVFVFTARFSNFYTRNKIFVCDFFKTKLQVACLATLLFHAMRFIRSREIIEIVQIQPFSLQKITLTMIHTKTSHTLSTKVVLRKLLSHSLKPSFWL